MPSPNLTFARAEAIREKVKEIKLTHHGQILDSLSVSAGISMFPTHGKDVNELINAADQAMYRGKAQGRDRVIVAESPRPENDIS